jgi:hypothetical protein
MNNKTIKIKKKEVRQQMVVTERSNFLVTFTYFWIRIEWRSLGSSLEHSRYSANVCYVDNNAKYTKNCHLDLRLLIQGRERGKWLGENVLRNETLLVPTGSKQKRAGVGCAGSSRSTEGLCQGNQIPFCSQTSCRCQAFCKAELATKSQV